MCLETVLFALETLFGLSSFHSSRLLFLLMYTLMHVVVLFLLTDMLLSPPPLSKPRRKCLAKLAALD